jgi:hypothetical protein
MTGLTARSPKGGDRDTWKGFRKGRSEIGQLSVIAVLVLILEILLRSSLLVSLLASLVPRRSTIRSDLNNTLIAHTFLLSVHDLSSAVSSTKEPTCRVEMYSREAQRPTPSLRAASCAQRSLSLLQPSIKTQREESSLSHVQNFIPFRFAWCL